ncbi:MAG: glycosyltransferase family 39 protein [bacterium]|nr:glycosyltransferase family 39 protein [bacterium]
MTRGRILIALLVIGVALRLAALCLRPEGALYAAPDEDEYLQIAQSVARGEGFALHGVTTAYRDMLLPVVCAALMALFGDSPLPMLLLNVLLSVATAILLFDLGRRRFGERVALIMAGVWLLYPTAIIFSAMLFTETLFVFLWVLAVWLYDRLDEGGYRPLDAVALGAVSGLLMLTRAVGVVVAVSLIIYIVLIRFERPLRVRLRAALILGAACLLVVLPWMVRNYFAVGRFALNTNGGINMYIGNNPRANGSYLFDGEHERLLPPAEAGEAARDRAAAGLALAFVREHPREALRLWERKFGFFWATDMTQWIHYFWDPSGPPSVSKRLRAMPVARLALLAVPYMLMVLLGISGFYLVRHFPARGLLLLQIFLLLLACFVTYGTPRYRYPVMPALVIGAGALWRSHVWVSAPPWRRLFLLFTLSMFVGIWLFEVMTIAGV